jgi:hypothetical protein
MYLLFTQTLIRRLLQVAAFLLLASVSPNAQNQRVRCCDAERELRLAGQKLFPQPSAALVDSACRNIRLQWDSWKFPYRANGILLMMYLLCRHFADHDDFG